MRGPMQQARAEFLLHASDLFGRRGLADAQLERGAAEGAQVHHPGEQA